MKTHIYLDLHVTEISQLNPEEASNLISSISTSFVNLLFPIVVLPFHSFHHFLYFLYFANKDLSCSLVKCMSQKCPTVGFVGVIYGTMNKSLTLKRGKVISRHR